MVCSGAWKSNGQAAWCIRWTEPCGCDWTCKATSGLAWMGQMDAAPGCGLSAKVLLNAGPICGVRYIRAPGRRPPWPANPLRRATRTREFKLTMTVTPPAAPPDSDLQLVERTVAGDQRAYELLVIKYQRRIERLIGRMVRDTDLVPDIAQETFIRAYRALHQFRGEAQFYTWLYRIAVNTAKKALMDMKRNPVISENALRGSDEEDETSRLGHELTSEETPETILAAREIAEAVNAAMEALPEDLRQAVTLREIEGLTYEEIAAAMECPIGTVRSRIFRAREAISARVRPLLENQSGKRW